MSCQLGSVSASSQKPAVRNPSHKSAAYSAGLSSSGIVKDTVTTQTALQGTNTNLMTQDLQSLPTMTSVQQQQQTDLTVETQKRTIREHPLYPLLALLFRQCETGTIRPTSPPSLEMFDEDLRDFIVRKERDIQHESAAAPRDCSQTSSPAVPPPSPTSHQQQSSQLYLQARLSNTKNRGGNINGNDCASAVRRHSYSATTPVANGTEYSPTQGDSRFDETGKNGAHKTGGRSHNDIPLTVFVDHRDLDELIVQAIKVLRIHLLELHKVNELSKDFCSRYIESLKTRFKSELMFQDSDPPSPDGSDAMSPYLSSHYQSYLPMCASTYGNHGYKLDELLPFGAGGDMQSGHPGGLSSDLSQVCASGSVTPDSSHRHSAEPGAFNCNSAAGYLGPNSYLNELKINGAGRAFPMGPYFPPRAAAVAAALNAGLDSLNCSGGGTGAGGKTKRGVLPKRATQVMKQWLFQHLVHPYPTENEKMEIAQQTSLTLLQVNNWFINARRRILQPMLDSSSSLALTRHGSDGRGSNGTKNCDSPINKKKKAATSRPSNNRFWPASLAAAAVLHPVAAGLISPNSSLQQSEMGMANSRNYHPKTVPAGSEIPSSADSAAELQGRKVSRVKRSPRNEQQQQQQSPMDSPESKRVRPEDESPQYNLSFEAATAQKLASMQLQQRQRPGFTLNGESEESHECAENELRRSTYLSHSSPVSTAERGRLVETGLGLQTMHVSVEKNGVPGSSSSSSSVSGESHHHHHQHQHHHHHHQDQQARKHLAHGYTEEQSSRSFLNYLPRTKLENHSFPYETQDLTSYQSHLLPEKQENLRQRESHVSSDLSHFSASTDIPGLEPMLIQRYGAYNNWYQCNNSHADEANSSRPRYQDLRETSGSSGGGGGGFGSPYDGFPAPRPAVSALLHENGASYFGQSCLGMEMYGHTPRQTATASATAAAAAAAAAWATQSFAGLPGGNDSGSRMTPFRYLHLPSSQQLWGAATYGLPPHGADFPGAVAAAGCSQKTELSPSSSSAASGYRFPGDLSGSGGDSGGSQKPSPGDPYSHSGHHHHHQLQQQQQQSVLADEVQGCKETLVNN
ncbi:Homeobox protein pknox2 [Sparganum proliferum]